MSDTNNPHPVPVVQEGPYTTLETRWGNKPGMVLLGEHTREILGTGYTSEALKTLALDRLNAKINEGETMVACHVYHNSSMGSVMIGAWHFDAQTHSEPVWAQGATI